MRLHGHGSILRTQAALICLAVVVRSVFTLQRRNEVEPITLGRYQGRGEALGLSLLQVAGRGEHGVKSLDDGTKPHGSSVTRGAAGARADHAVVMGEATELEQEAFAQAQERAKRDYGRRNRAASGALRRPKGGDEELGEGAPGAAARNAEKSKKSEVLKKAQEKTTKGIETVKSQNDAYAAEKKRTMEELVEKNTQIRDESTRKADELLRDAPADWQAKWNKKMAHVKQRWERMREKGNKHLRELESKLAVQKTTRTTHWMQKITKARESVNKLQESQKADYLQQMAMFDQTRSKEVERAKVAYAKEVAAMKKLQQQSSENMASQSEAVKAKYRDLIKGVERTKKTALQKLAKLQREAAKEAKKRLAANKVKFKHKQVAARKKDKEAMAQSKALLRQAADVKKEMDANKDLLRKFKEQYRSKLEALKLNGEKKKNQIDNDMRLARTKAKSDLRATKEEGKARVEKTMDDEAQKEEKHKEKEISWESKARMNARQDCEDARETANMKVKAAKFAAHRVSRDAQSEALITNNHWQDAEKKARDLDKGKEKRAKALERVSTKEAIEMAHAMYGKEPKIYDMDTKWPSEAESSVEPTVVKIANEQELDQASGKFAATFVPADKQVKIAKQRRAVAQKAKLAAAKHTWVWANNHASKIARTVHEKAEKTCAQSRRFFNEAETTVASRVDEIGAQKKKVLSAAEANATSWENATRQKIYAVEDAGLKRDRHALKETSKATADESAALNADAKKKLAEKQKAIDDALVKWQQLKGNGKLKGELAATSLKNRLKEIQQERELQDKEAASMEKKQIKRSTQEKAKLEEVSVKQVDNYKQREIDALQKLKDTAGPVSPGKIVEQEAQLKSQRDAIIQDAKADFKVRVDRLNADSKKQVEKAMAASKLRISKYKKDLKQDVKGADERMQKAIVKEKQEQQRVNLRKETTKEKGEKEKVDFMSQVRRKKKKLLQDAKSKMKAANKKAEADYTAKVYEKAKETMKQIHQIKDKVLASFDQPDVP